MVRTSHICTGLVVISTLFLVTNYVFRNKNVMYSKDTTQTAYKEQTKLAQKHPNDVQLLFSYYDLDTLLCREELEWNLTRLYYTPEMYENCPKKGITSVLFIKGRTGKIPSVIFCNGP